MSTRKTALITGANKGIGREIARQLGQQGFSVWLGCRDAARGEQAAADLRKEGFDAYLLALDVSNDASVKAAAGTYGKTNDTLDVLVNNAGVATGGYIAPSEASLDDMRAVYEVNVFGPVRVTQAFVAFLRKAGQGRIVMMSSSVGSIGEQLDMTSGTYGVNLLGYNSSKAALNAITLIYASTLRGTGIRVNALSPGFCATDLNNHTGHLSADEGGAHIARQVTLPGDGPTAVFLSENGGTYPW